MLSRSNTSRLLQVSEPAEWKAMLMKRSKQARVPFCHEVSRSWGLT